MLLYYKHKVIVLLMNIEYRNSLHTLYKKNKINYELLSDSNKAIFKHMDSKTNSRQSGGGASEIYSDFIDYRKQDLRKKVKGLILTGKLYAEILNPAESPYNNAEKVLLTDSLSQYLKDRSVEQQRTLGLDVLLADAAEESAKIPLLLAVLQKQGHLIAAKEKEEQIKREFQRRCDEWDVQMIYDGSQKASPEGRLFLGGFETGADVRFGHGKVCIPGNKIGLAITIMQESYLGDQQWTELSDAFGSHGIRNVQIKNIVDYKVDDMDATDVEMTQDERLNRQKLFIEMLTQMVPQIDAAISSGQNILVHCIEGKSRSVSLVAAWLAKKLGLSAEEAYQYIKKIRKIADPNKDYVKAVTAYLKL